MTRKRIENPNRRTLDLKFSVLVLLLSACGVLFFLSTGTAVAQSVESNAHGKTSVDIKVSSISPAAGISYGVSNSSELRILGFVTTYSNLSTHDDQLFLDLSYLRYTNWIKNSSFNSYWGVDVNMLFEEPLIGPGVLLGTSYHISSKFAIFAEAGLNLFIRGDGGDATIGLHNSGVGIKVNF